MQPLEITRSKSSLSIKWNKDDLTPHIIPAKSLRSACPCASCKMERGIDTHSAPLTPSFNAASINGPSSNTPSQQPVKKNPLQVIDHSLDESLEIKEIWAVGQYALGIKWGDGHDTGIYPFGLLRGLG